MGEQGGTIYFSKYCWQFEFCRLTMLASIQPVLVAKICILDISSTGPLADSGQNHVLGHYSKFSDGPDYWNYQQTAGYRRTLWYNLSIKAWFIGNNLVLVSYFLEIIEEIKKIAY